MFQAKSLMLKVVWLAARGALLGASLGAVFPTEDTTAECFCDDDGSGELKCTSGSGTCVAGNQECDAYCEPPLPN
jgi:hypothetical protein